MRTLTTLGLAGALGVGLLAGPVIAQETDDDTTVEQSDRPTAEEREAAREERRAEFAASLAEKLGVSVEDVEAALDEIQAEHQAERLAMLEERLAEKVEAGELTQEEADEILERAENGDFPRRGPRGHHGPRGRGGPGPGPGPDGDGPAAEGAVFDA